MSRLTDEFLIELPLDKTSWACRDAISSIGWNIESLDPHRIIPKVGVGLTRNPSKIEVLLSDTTPSSSTVTLKGVIFGIGPHQKRHLSSEMNRLRNAIEVAARHANP